MLAFTSMTTTGLRTIELGRTGMRITRVGGSKELFSNDALALLHEAAAGSLRDIDRLATAALRLAARRKRKAVDRDVLARVVQSDGGDRS